MKIISEDQAVETRTSELLFEWEKNKPVQGSTRPDAALNNLAIFEGKFSRLKEDRDNVARAKEALELMEPGVIYVDIIFSCLNTAKESLVLKQASISCTCSRC